MTLKEKIASRKFVVLGEFEPPKGADFSSFLKNVNLARGRVDAFVVPEMANAVLKASSLGGCAFLDREGIEAVLQVCCRDRNRLALQADILSAGALGVKNVMCVPGVDISYGDNGTNTEDEPKEDEPEEPKTSNKCPECGSDQIEHDSEGKYCKKCGLSFE